jgi:hypothetical protein
MSDFDPEKKDKTIEGVVENPVEIKSEEAEVVSALESADTKYVEFESRSEELLALILSDDISESEKDVFRQELKKIKEDGKTLRKKTIDKLCAAILIVPIALGNLSEAYSIRFGEKSKKIKGIEFVFDNLEIENKEKYRREWKKIRGSDDSLSAIEVPEFPLDNEGLEILQYCNKKDIYTIYDIEILIRIANDTHALIKKGISLDTLKHIRLPNYIDSELILNNDESVKKIKILQKIGIGLSETVFSRHDVEQMSLEQIKLLEKNPYVDFLLKDYFDMHRLATYLNEENLQKIKDFDSEISEIRVKDFITFCEVLSSKSQDVIDVYKTQYDKDGDKALCKISTHETKRLHSLSTEKLSLVKRLIKESSFSIYQDSIEPYTRLDENIFDRCKVLGIEDINAAFFWHMYYLSGMSEDQFEMLVELRKCYDSSLGNQIESVKNIDNIFEKDELKDLISILHKIDSTREDLDPYFKNKTTLTNIKHFLETIDKETNIDIIDFVTKVYGIDKLRSLCLYDLGREDLAKLMSALKENPSSLISDIIDNDKYCRNVFVNFLEVQSAFKSKAVDFSDEDINSIFSKLLINDGNILTLLEENSFPLNDQKKKNAVKVLVRDKSTDIIPKFRFFDDQYLSSITDTEERQEILDRLFKNVVSKNIEIMMEDDIGFPFTPEQQRYIDVFKRVKNSPSRELKNLASEILPLMYRFDNFEEADEAVSRIEKTFLTNNIPMIGKQYKIFEILYPDKILNNSILSKSKVESLKALKDPSKQRLTIFKDLMRSHIASCDSNLEQYLTVLQSGRYILDKFDQGIDLIELEKNKLKLFLKKINVLSGHTGRQSIAIGEDVSDDVMYRELNDLKNAFGVQDGGSLIQRFERTFLKRIGIESIDDALSLMKEYKKEASIRNEENAKDGVLKMREGDLVKGISSYYLDTYLDKGVYAPEFVGAASAESKKVSKDSDATPFDTDLFIVEDGYNFRNAHTEYGDMYIIVKKKPQFEKDKLDIFKTGVIGQNHYGIRTGFGSTQIDAICIRQEGIKPRGIDKIKFFIAQKGFYIPIYNIDGEIVFTKEEYDKYRKVFDGVDRFEGGDMDISEGWKDSNLAQDIEGIAQTEEGIQSIETVRNIIQDKIKAILEEGGVNLHKGEYDDSLAGAIITDTGSTGRGSALDEKFDFDFAVKLDDNDWDKVLRIMDKLKDVFPIETSYENKGMMMFRSKDVEINGHKMTIDVGFNKKSDSEEFDAHTALGEKYRSIEKTHGRQALLNTLTNVRFAKKKLKEAGCYKKGLGDNGQQGGLGGIGVEYWIIQNGGDVVRAFGDFLKVAIIDNAIIPFDEFKKVYKVFSAGVNIRGNQKVENFVENMTEVGYEKMVKLATDLTS